MSSKSERRERARQERLQAEADQAAQERRRRLIQFGAIGVFAAAIVVVALIVISQSGSDSSSGGDTAIEGAAQVNARLDGVEQNGITLGDPKATATITEFGDLQCPVCAQYSEQVTPGVIDSLVKPGKAQLAFKNFTIIGPQSTDAALAAMAAGEQGRYWQFIDLFYANQGTENSGYATDAFLEAVAKGAGVKDIDKWNTDRDSAALKADLAGIQDEATKLGFHATPSFEVTGPNGTKTFTAPSPQELAGAVNEVG